MADLAVVIVNYNSSDFLRGCLASLAEADGGSIQVVVVDNGSDPEDRAAVHEMAGPDVDVLDAPDNPGYGAGLNRGIARTDAPFLALMNPDTRVLAGAFGILRRVVAEPLVGVAGPRTFMDDALTLQHPINRVLTPGRFVSSVRSLGDARSARRFTDGYTRYALGYWTASVPRPIEMLSGACLFTRREVLEKVGGFDESFPLYFEDADWCVRLRAFGYRLEYVPDAMIVHYHGVSSTRSGELSTRRLEVSEARYAEKHFGRVGFHRYLRASRARQQRLERGATVAPWPLVDLGALTEPATIPTPAPSLAQIAGTPRFEYPVASLCDAGSFRIPGDLWSRMGPGPWFVRVVKLDGRSVLGAWVFRKRA